MRWWDAMFMAQGRYVRHAYGKPRAGRSSCCARCGVRRRRRSSGWEYAEPGKAWTMSNPPCIARASA